MDSSRLLIVAMAEKCGDVIEHAEFTNLGLPRALGLKHLLWMCRRIAQDAENWPAARLHRWIGFVQGGMMANRLLDFEHLKAMFDEAKNAYGQNADDRDLIDHLDPRSSFKLEIGGQG